MNKHDNPSRAYLDNFIIQALNEDIGDGDHTSLACISGTSKGKAHELVFINNRLIDIIIQNIKLFLNQPIKGAYSAPFKLYLDLTYKCQARCPFCIYKNTGNNNQTSFDWNLLQRSQTGQHDKNRGQDIPMILAGGLNEENAASAISLFHPYCLDVSSSVETEGRKDPDKIKRFIDRVRA